MPGFLGQFEFQIDAKGRVSLPSAFRRRVSGGSLILLQWQDSHLDLMPPETWEQIQRKLLEHRRARADGGAYLRRITARAVEVEPDNQGRIRIPSWLQEKAGLEGTVLLIGAVDRIELWSPARFEEETEAGGAEFDEFAPQIFG